MPGPDSRVSICNVALGHVEQDPIVNFIDQNKRANACRLYFDAARRQALGDHIWKCALKQAQLAASPTPPPFGFANAYPKPADFISLYKVGGETLESGGRWRVVGTTIQTNQGSPLDAEYIFDLQDYTQFDPLLTRAVEYRLAAYLCKPLTGKSDDRAALEKLALDAAGEARFRDSQQDSPREFNADILLRSRR